MNCWEFKSCGREAGGAQVGPLGACPAFPKNGRNCCRVAGTLCAGKVQGTFAQKLGNCLACDFYKISFADQTRPLLA